MDAPTKNASKNANPATNQAVNAAPVTLTPALNTEKAKALRPRCRRSRSSSARARSCGWAKAR